MKEQASKGVWQTRECSPDGIRMELCEARGLLLRERLELAHIVWVGVHADDQAGEVDGGELYCCGA